MYRVGQKRSHSEILTDLHFFTGRLLSKFAVKWTLKIPPHLEYVATLPCERLIIWLSAKQAINDKLQGSVDRYFRCGGVVNNQIKKGLLLNVWVFFLIGEYLAKIQARAWLSHALCAPGQHTANRRKTVTISQNYGHESVAPLFVPPCSAHTFWMLRTRFLRKSDAQSCKCTVLYTFMRTLSASISDWPA